MPDDRSVWIGTAWGALVGTAVGVVGFFLTRYPATKGMGVALFFVVPFAAGKVERAYQRSLGKRTHRAAGQNGAQSQGLWIDV